MRRSRIVLSALVAAALAACGGTELASPSLIEPSPSQSLPNVTPAATTEVTPAPTEPAARAIEDVLYQVDADGTHHVLTVFVPTAEGGPWPTVVMIHGAGGYPLIPEGSVVAAAGAVVFAPHWSDNAAFRADSAAGIGQLACAVRFARAEAERFGGDPVNLTLYGHSAGANHAAMIALTGPEVGAGCQASAGSIVPAQLVLFEGDWLLLGDPTWDQFLRDDPGALDLLTPWTSLEQGPRIAVHVLDSNDESLSSPFDEATFALRDPTGDFRRELEAAGLLADGRMSESDQQWLFVDRLQALGYSASLDTLPGSFHTFISSAAMPVVLRAILGP